MAYDIYDRVIHMHAIFDIILVFVPYTHIIYTNKPI